MTRLRALSLPLAALGASMLLPFSAAAQATATPEECLRMRAEPDRLRRSGLQRHAAQAEQRMAALCVCHVRQEPMVSCAGRCDGPGLA